MEYYKKYLKYKQKYLNLSKLNNVGYKRLLNQESLMIGGSIDELIYEDYLRLSDARQQLFFRVGDKFKRFDKVDELIYEDYLRLSDARQQLFFRVGDKFKRF